MCYYFKLTILPLKQTLKLNNFPKYISKNFSESEFIQCYSFAVHVSERRKYLKKLGKVPSSDVWFEQNSFKSLRLYAISPNEPKWLKKLKPIIYNDDTSYYAHVVTSVTLPKDVLVKLSYEIANSESSNDTPLLHELGLDTQQKDMIYHMVNHISSD